MSDTYQPVVGDDTEYMLANTSTAAMEAIDRLQVRAPFAGENIRQQKAENYGYEDPEAMLDDMADGMVSPPQFWEEAATVLFDGLDTVPDGGVDYAEVRRAFAVFTNAGNEQLSELINGSNG